MGKAMNHIATCVAINLQLGWAFFRVFVAGFV